MSIFLKVIFVLDIYIVYYFHWHYHIINILSVHNANACIQVRNINSRFIFLLYSSVCSITTPLIEKSLSDFGTGQMSFTGEMPVSLPNSAKLFFIHIKIKVKQFIQTKRCPKQFILNPRSPNLPHPLFYYCKSMYLTAKQ